MRMWNFIASAVFVAVILPTKFITNAADAAWIDAATGQPVWTNPYTYTPEGGGGAAVPAGYSNPDHDHAFLPQTGQNLFWDRECRTWKDSKTGKEVWTNPYTYTPGGGGGAAVPVGYSNPDHDHAFLPQTGQNLFWQPCPPPPQSTGLQTTPSTSWTGGYLGGELVKNWGRVRSTETLAATGAITNQFSDSGDPFGLGLVAGYNFTPWNTNFVIGPFASADWMRQTINHNFAGGQFLGSTTNWIFTVGGKAGVVATPGLLLYGLAGAAFLNQNLNVNFVTAASNNTTTPGFTLGVGGEYQPQSWMLAGSPVSVFGQYQHTWWSTANFNTPASSPAFNYSFRRQDDTIKLGVLIHFSPQLPAPVVSKY